jgi:copper chaperone CopZ
MLIVALLVLGVNCSEAPAQHGVWKIQIVAKDMCCKGCAQKVGAQLYTVPGVTSVAADVPGRTVTVTAKPSPKLTLERLWRAVEQGKGGPSKLVSPQGSYVLTRPENLRPEDRLPPGQYSLVFRTLHDRDSAQRIANQLYLIRGVKNVRIDAAKHAMLIESASDSILSPWALITAVERARVEPIAVGGPHGLLTIERPADANPETAARSNSPRI